MTIAKKPVLNIPDNILNMVKLRRWFNYSFTCGKCDEYNSFDHREADVVQCKWCKSPNRIYASWGGIC
jgi:hypothetical protein